MKKTFFTLLVGGMLTITSCTETFEPSVDYGDQTYINDYAALITAVNDLNNSLSDRMDALNTMLKQGLADIKVAIDANTAAITLMDENLNKTLLDGFTALNTTIDENGNKIITAMNKNGETLKLAIDGVGNLISTSTTTLATKLEAMIKAMELQNEGLDALIQENGIYEFAADKKTICVSASLFNLIQNDSDAKAALMNQMVETVPICKMAVNMSNGNDNFTLRNCTADERRPSGNIDLLPVIATDFKDDSTIPEIYRVYKSYRGYQIYVPATPNTTANISKGTCTDARGNATYGPIHEGGWFAASAYQNYKIVNEISVTYK